MAAIYKRALRNGTRELSPNGRAHHEDLSVYSDLCVGQRGGGGEVGEEEEGG